MIHQTLDFFSDNPGYLPWQPRIFTMITPDILIPYYPLTNPLRTPDVVYARPASRTHGHRAILGSDAMNTCARFFFSFGGYGGYGGYGGCYFYFNKITIF